MPNTTAENKVSGNQSRKQVLLSSSIKAKKQHDIKTNDFYNPKILHNNSHNS